MKGQKEFREEEKRNYVVVKLNEELDIPVLKNLFEEGKKHGLEGLAEASETFPEIKTKPLFTRVKPEKLAKLRATAEQKAKRKFKDLNLFYRIECGPKTDPEKLVTFLNRLPSVERAYVEIPAMEPMPNGTPDFTNQQGYLDPSPLGVNAEFAWTVPGGRGGGINFIDVERGWTLDHEDLLGAGPTLIVGDIRPESRQHGTAVLGEIVGVLNTFGVTGIATNVASVRVASYWDSVTYNGSVAAAIMSAVDLLDPGDVLLIEAQINLYPVEIDLACYAAIELAVGLGIVVVEAAGNGGHDLDAYTDALGDHIFDPSFRDSGAIIVGAGAAGNFGPDRSRMYFSNYGTRVNCQGWGEQVVTCGWKASWGTSLYDGGTDQTLYTEDFRGTSSASPIVAGAALCIQGIAENNLGHRLSPGQIRYLVSTFGAPQTDNLPTYPATQHIGVLPDLQAIIPEIGVLPDIYIRDNVTDSGQEPVVGGISTSPDIILSKTLVANPQVEFGLTTYDRADLGHKAEAGQDNYIYVRLQNRGTVTADATVTIYWSEVATLVTPDDWHYIGEVVVPNVAPSDFKVSDPIVWPAAQIPATGHYCLVGIVDTPLDPAPPTPAFDDFDDFRNFIRNSNNVTWRNFNVVDVDPDVAEPIELPFLIRGAPKEVLPMSIEIVKVLPPEAKVDLEVPARLVADIPILRGHFTRLDARLARLPIGKSGLRRLHEIKLRRRAKYPSKLVVKLEKRTPAGNYYVAVRQVYKGKEVGRVTWMLRVKEGKKKPPRVKEKR
jgi:hypothetical protein